MEIQRMTGVQNGTARKKLSKLDFGPQAEKPEVPVGRCASVLGRSNEILAFEQELHDLLLSASKLTSQQQKTIEKALESAFDLFQVPILIDSAAGKTACSLIDVASLDLFKRIQGIVTALSTLIMSIAESDQEGAVDYDASFVQNADTASSVVSPDAKPAARLLKSPVLDSINVESLDKLSPLTTSYSRRRPSANSSYLGSPLKNKINLKFGLPYNDDLLRPSSRNSKESRVSANRGQKINIKSEDESSEFSDDPDALTNSRRGSGNISYEARNSAKPYLSLLSHSESFKNDRFAEGLVGHSVENGNDGFNLDINRGFNLDNNRGFSSDINNGFNSDINNGFNSDINKGFKSNINNGSNSIINNGSNSIINNGFKTNINNGSNSIINKGFNSNINNNHSSNHNNSNSNHINNSNSNLINNSITSIRSFDHSRFSINGTSSPLLDSSNLLASNLSHRKKSPLMDSPNFDSVYSANNSPTRGLNRRRSRTFHEFASAGHGSAKGLDIPTNRMSFPGFSYNKYEHGNPAPFIEGFDENMQTSNNQIQTANGHEYGDMFIDMSRNLDYTLSTAMSPPLQGSSYSQQISHHKQQLKKLEALEKLKQRASSRNSMQSRKKSISGASERQSYHNKDLSFNEFVRLTKERGDLPLESAEFGIPRNISRPQSVIGRRTNHLEYADRYSQAMHPDLYNNNSFGSLNYSLDETNVPANNSFGHNGVDSAHRYTDYPNINMNSRYQSKRNSMRF